MSGMRGLTGGGSLKGGLALVKVLYVGLPETNPALGLPMTWLPERGLVAPSMPMPRG